MTKKKGKNKIIAATVLAAVAALCSCVERIPDEAIKRMDAYQVHFDAILYYIFICNDDGLAGFYFDGEPLKYVRIRQPITTGIWNAYISEENLVLTRPNAVRTVKMEKDFAGWWSEHFADGAPVWVYDKEE